MYHALLIRYVLDATQVLPATGAATGGLEIEISGGGFGTSIEGVLVEIGGKKCSVQQVTMNIITCITPDLVDGFHDIIVSKKKKFENLYK